MKDINIPDKRGKEDYRALSSIEGVSCFVKDELGDFLCCESRNEAYNLIERETETEEMFIRLIVTLGLGDIYWSRKRRFLKRVKNFKKSLMK